MTCAPTADIWVCDFSASTTFRYGYTRPDVEFTGSGRCVAKAIPI